MTELGNPFLLLLHGLGGNGDSMSYVRDYCEHQIVGSDFISLEGPINLGSASIPSLGWFVPSGDEFRAIDDPRGRKPKGINQSVSYVQQEIEGLLSNGVRAEDVYLLGHSQGGATAIAAGLTFSRRLGGVFTIAGYVALGGEMTPRSNGTPFMLHHSNYDHNVNVRWSHYARNYISGLGGECDVTCWKIPENPHGIHKCQIDAICDVIQNTCSDTT